MDESHRDVNSSLSIPGVLDLSPATINVLCELMERLSDVYLSTSERFSQLEVSGVVDLPPHLL